LGFEVEAQRWRGPHPRRTLAVATTLPLVVAAATLAAIAVLIANAAYDYQLQTAHLGMLHGVHGSCGPDCLQIQEQATRPCTCACAASPWPAR
jgi:hypothetical protein